MAVSRRLGEMMRVKCLVRCLCSLNGTHRCHPQNYLLKENLCQEGTGTKKSPPTLPKISPFDPITAPSETEFSILLFTRQIYIKQLSHARHSPGPLGGYISEPKIPAFVELTF